ncbi:MAG: T9SS type A sorting domain-containing protein [Bacteroidetes bacterium]|nr:T9SS type A sorting domain-containing protein [Bacteroidota bacterium]
MTTRTNTLWNSGTNRTTTGARTIRTSMLALVAFFLLALPVLAGPIIKIRTGRPAHDCTGFGICSITIGNLDPTAAFVPAEGTLNGNQLTLAFHERPQNAGEILPVDQPITLDAQTAAALGSSNVTVLPGQYTMDYRTNPFGTVTLPVQPQGLVINIRIGRRSMDCQGFGICSITIGRDPLANALGAAKLNGNTLHVDFTSKLPQQGSALVIDQPITVDSAFALGAASLVIPAGTYPVDYTNNPNGSVDLPVQRIGITIEVEIGRKSRDCRGFGICSISVSLDIDLSLKTSSVATLNGNTLHLDFTSKLPEQGDALVIDEPITVDSATATALGAASVVVLPGTYAVDYTKNPNGSVDIPVQRIGITINVDIGRKSRDCKGFGICSITIEIDIDLSSRVPAVSTLNGNTLHLDFASKLPEQGDALVIDEPITVDSATARALGAAGLVVLPGTYRVDYTRNPNGSVDIPVQRIGITIEVEIGRRSKGCTGFGICSITIGLDIDLASRVPAIATLNGNMLHLDFASKLPEQGDALVIDEPITVDSAAALGLGASSFVIPAGTYRVDYTRNPNGSVDIPVQRIGITIEVEIGRKSKGCTGFGICSVTIGLDLDLALKTPAAGSLNGNTLHLDFASKLPEQGDALVIDEPITVDSATAKALGATSLVIPAGTYRVDYTKNPNGSVDLPVQRIGITINVEIGRRSKGCTGFGICSITIGLDIDLASRVPAVSTVNGNMLHLEFASKLPVQGDALVIDEPITVDSATAKALGAASLVIPAGTYRVNYTKNPNGSVDLPMQRFGIDINIRIGRPNQNCRGFGICSITIGFTADDQTAASARLKGNVLHLDLKSMPAEHGDVLMIDEPLELDPNVARALGAKSLVVRPGAYTVDYTKNPYGSVDLTVQRLGFTVEVTVGRPSQNCAGFGICRVRILLDATAKHGTGSTVLSAENDAPALMSAENGMITMELESVPASSDSVLHIDAPLTLDSSVAAVLGYNTIVPGEYAVDYSSNPNGTVQMFARNAEISGVEEAQTGGSVEHSMVAPNPSHGTTTIRFSLAKPQAVTVTLTDARGNVVATLANGTMMNAGDASVEFDAAALPNGIYFYAIRSGSSLETGRLVVAK